MFIGILTGMKKNWLKIALFLTFFFGILAPAGAAAPSESGETARIIFIGDIMTHVQQLEASAVGDSWNFAPQFRRVKPLFKDALIVGNLETVFAGSKAGFAGYPSFNTPDVLTDALKELGVDIVTLANNHILDRGIAGAARTVSVLDSSDILWTGLAVGGVEPHSSLTVDYEGLRWSFISFSYGSNRAVASGDVKLNVISEQAVLDGLEHARTMSSDVIVACFHWGNEYQFKPTARQRRIAELCRENGADLVIGTHPHVLQPIEVQSSDQGHTLTAYSLGNFVSFQRTLPRERSCILAVDFVKVNGKAVLKKVSVAPTRVAVRRLRGGRLVEVVYAGKSPLFNHAGLPASEVRAAQSAGEHVLDFLGAAEEAGSDGFYTVWDSDEPDRLPLARRKSPQ